MNCNSIKINKIILLSGFLLLTIGCLSENLKQIVNLKGEWHFTVGDDLHWANPKFNDSGWDKIHVPDKWEKHGYDGYNGYAWYRKTFYIEALKKQEVLFILLGKIDDADEVYLNGHLIGKTGNFFPNYQSQAKDERNYQVPAHLFNFNGNNVIAVRVYDSYLGGGIKKGNVGVYVDADIQYLTINLSGSWKFTTGNKTEYKNIYYDDSWWKEIRVPGKWENLGYENYNGFAWYRKRVYIPDMLHNKELVLVLGRIDDIDKTYFNNELIGEVDDIKSYDKNYRSSDDEWKVTRAYPIPKDLLRRKNLIAIQVLDTKGDGGIYNGPIGIMTKPDYDEFKKRYKEASFWDWLYDEITN